MKSIIAFVAGAVALAVVAGLLFLFAGYQREMAAAEEHLATQRYAAAAEKLDSAAEYAGYGRWLPGAGGQAARDLRAHQASLQYWQREYDALLPRDADPVGAVESEDVSLQLLVANGAYRAGQSKATDREATLQVLDEAVTGYLTVLRNDEWDERAAYNYEYLVRLRDDLARGRRKSPPPPPDEGNSALGAAGAPEKSRDMKQFEVYIPLEGEERNQASEAGKAAPNARKG
jgi:hypothetical protein